MRVAVATQRCPQAGVLRRRRILEQAGQVGRFLACGGLLNRLRGGRADTGELGERTRADPLCQLTRR
jgi:hypothetical protein